MDVSPARPRRILSERRCGRFFAALFFLLAGYSKRFSAFGPAGLPIATASPTSSVKDSSGAFWLHGRQFSGGAWAITPPYDFGSYPLEKG